MDTTTRLAARVSLSFGLALISAACGSRNTPAATPPAAACGNAVVEAGETCDTAIVSGAGSCPTSCDDGDACTTDALSGSACTAACTHTAVTACSPTSDGCCPPGCDSSNDTDCTPASQCGDGQVGPGETCDTGISAGQSGACPTTCDDHNACTTDTLQNPGTCTAACTATPIMTCSDADGCCPVGCDASNDSDCEALTPFTAGYTCASTSYRISGQEPSAAGAYPLFVFTVGTWETYNDLLATTIVSAMARRGYVSATVEYENNSFGLCPTISARAACIYDASSSASALQALCGRPRADCSKGIVVAGFSQGSIIADLAKGYDSRVQAAWGFGDGVNYSGYDLTSCVGAASRTLPSDRLRVVNGEQDMFMGSNADSVRAELETLTGYDCGAAAYDCLQANGAGWYIVQDSEVHDGAADHCYVFDGGCLATGALDPGFLSGSAPFSLGPNLDWLQSFTEK